ncbi:MoaA/NifB/PqqE/SkfB family radical SAM enzyme [Desulfobaculum xiamenense]|uniref:MoaA/NifB/PqqE/SkfB family radical SAM enzyme n=1 Tax=Desulfobaculum xiamenense TaxID=995050 RepID=A0A846QEC2_9BACT|nr:radical SAM/SPASM domain-containing protein [Desulfobaculum xiamenense]NJB67086.1 MoaA/NifB/PqqE/SkfB family radical SAM enzyme [Desulfobaculum xiamenense]
MAFKIDPNISYAGTLRSEMHYALTQRRPAGYLMHRLRWRWLPRLGRVSRFPEHVDIETCSVCQLACPMCFQTVRKDISHGFMDFPLFERVMAEVAGRRPYSIRLSWRGECLLHPEFARMLHHARSVYDGSISFLTNSLLLDERLMELLVRTRTDYIVISADGVGSTYDSVRRPGVFDELVSRLGLLAQIKRRNGASYPKVRINAVGTWFTPEERAEFLRIFGPLSDRILIGEMLSNFAEHVPAHDASAFCASPWQRLLVGWDGSVHPCCCDYAGLYPMGNVRETSLYDIWHGKRAHVLRKLVGEGRRLDLRLCRETDCGVDENDNECSEVFMGLLRAQVVRQHGLNSPLLRYLDCRGGEVCPRTGKMVAA